MHTFGQTTDKLLYYLTPKKNALLLLEINQWNFSLEGGRKGGTEKDWREEGREEGKKGETEGGRKAERDRRREKERACVNLQAGSQVAHDRSPSPP